MDPDLVAHWAAAPGDLTEALFAHGGLLLVTFDNAGRVARSSAALDRLLGAPPVGRPLTDLVVPDDAARLTAEVLPLLARRGRAEGVDLILRDAHGAGVPVRAAALAELDAAGAYLGGLAVLTDQREARDALAALDRKAAEAQEASEAKSRFLAAMSHEIRTPMNAIMGFAQLLDLSDLDETRRSHVRAIMSAGGSLMTLLTDLLDLSQVEAGHMRIEARAFDLFDLLDEVAEWWRRSAADRGLSLTVTADRTLPRRIVSDPVRLQQVLNNYLGNAVKFTPEGRIALSLRRQAAPGGPDVVRFAVADTGPGIAAGDVSRLFKPFVQVGADSTTERGGWGLGLSICANIAEAMNGAVGVDSAPGAGSTFWLDVPLRAASGEAVATPAGAATAAGTPSDGAGPAGSPLPDGDAADPLRVLLAEDDALNREVMQRMLAEMGHEVTVAADGFAALAALERAPFDVVVMDVMMPGLDGVAATRRLRAAAHGRRDIPVIGCSAHVSPEAEARYREIGMDAFLAKPVERARLRALLAEAARGRAPGGLG